MTERYAGIPRWLANALLEAPLMALTAPRAAIWKRTYSGWREPTLSGMRRMPRRQMRIWQPKQVGGICGEVPERSRLS